jgi:hypothetical protein
MISWSTQCDFAEAGEQITIRNIEPRIAARSWVPRSEEAGSSSRSRNTGDSRRGTSPTAVTLPTSFGGMRYDSTSRWSRLT